jgi:vacuolar-type H+-ATPase subunit I/STV1
MKTSLGLGALLLAGLLVIPGNLWLASQVLAQSEAQTTEDQQLQELRRKRQEERRERERVVTPGERRQDAIKRQQDAVKRQKAAEQRLRELEEEEN